MDSNLEKNLMVACKQRRFLNSKFRSHTCMVLTNVAPFKKEINRLSIKYKMYASNHCYNKDIINTNFLNYCAMIYLTKTDIKLVTRFNCNIHE